MVLQPKLKKQFRLVFYVVLQGYYAGGTRVPKPACCGYTRVGRYPHDRRITREKVLVACCSFLFFSSFSVTRIPGVAFGECTALPSTGIDIIINYHSVP